MPYLVASLDAGLALLEAIANHPDLGLTDIATRAGTTKSQTFRLLHTLEARGFVIRDATKRTYRLGYRALYVGERARRQTNLITRAQPFLDELSALSRENVHLIAREGLHSVCIALAESPQPLRLYAQVGRLGPLHAGGGSKVMLAFAPEEIRTEVLTSPLERYNDATITDPERLAAILAQIRRDGHHLAMADIDEHAFAISAPIRDHTDAVVAAISIAGPTYRLHEGTLERFRDLVLTTAARISAALR
jgi:IclR family transcriptional regulator, KDG regulon repressor